MASQRGKPLYDHASIIAYADGLPSEAFGAPYQPFDHDRVIARLPRDPYKFLDQVVHIEGCQAFAMKAGGQIEAQYAVPADAWYFAANRCAEMPFAVLLEVALQPCGWLSAYVGSALCSDSDIKYRNLGGKARQLRPITPDSGILSTKVHMTEASMSGGMIIQHFRMRTYDTQGLVYDGTTYFGFFAAAALENQVGLRDGGHYELSSDERARAERRAYPQQAPFCSDRLRMIDTVTHWVADGGPAGLGVAIGEQPVDEAAWFFEAHFKQDPVCPGSLGVEGFVQLIKFAAAERWGVHEHSVFRTLEDGEHEWIYRGQYVQTADLVTTSMVITAIDEATHTLPRMEYSALMDARSIA